MNKPKLYLISNKILKKKYNRFLVFLCDESHFEFDMNEWDIRSDEEWIEVEKLDKTEKDCFAIQNILRVRFVCVEKKNVSNMVKDSTLKPVA